MITKFKKFNEGINHLLVGPTEEEIWNDIKDLQPQDMLYKSYDIKYDKGIKYAIEQGADYTKLTNMFNYVVKLLNLSNEDVIEFMKLQGNNSGDILRISSYLHFKYGTDYAISNGALEGLTPNNLLIKSCKIGYLDGVKRALRKRANINANNGQPLTISETYNKYDIMKYLIEQGAYINPRDIYFINKIIERSTLNQDIEFVEYLYNKGYKLKDDEEHNSQALQYAWTNDNPELMKIIIKMGGNPSKAKNTMLRFSIFDNEIEKVKVLLDGGADLEITDDLITELENKNHIDKEMIELLKKYKNK